MKATSWYGYVLVNKSGVVLGVYGSLSQDLAVKQQEELVKKFATAIDLRSVVRDLRPRVGDVL